VNLHKKRALCTGTRDPGAFVRRSELATPAGIDRDFNFLTAIERGIEGGEGRLRDGGVDLRHDVGEGGRGRGGGRGGRGGRGGGVMQEKFGATSNFEKAIQRTGVRIRKAPKGMQRAKENKTSWNKKYVQLTLVPI
jgi:hypothetical protein